MTNLPVTIPIFFTCHNCSRKWEMHMEWTIIGVPVPTEGQNYWTMTCSVCTPNDGPDPQNIPGGGGAFT